MAIIKSFSDFQQSKKLAEFLPIESADMRIGNYVGKSGKVDGTNIHYFANGESFGAPEIIEAWSLAALFSVLPNDTSLLYFDDAYQMVYDKKPYVISNKFDNPVDACVAMVEKLHELKIL